MKSAMASHALPAIGHQAQDSSAFGQFADETQTFRAAKEAQISAARRRPAFAWIGLLALLAPWGAGALLWAALRVV